MTQKWNLQDIRPAEPRPPRPTMPATVISNGDMRATQKSPNPQRPISHSAPQDHTREPEDLEIDMGDSIPVINGKKRSRNHLVIAIVLFVFIAGAGLVLSALTAGATVTVEPKEREINVNAEFTAYKEQKAGELSYEIITLEATDERQVEASGQEEVKEQARGELEISNSTTEAQRLIKNTRFATEDGKIFRIEESVVIPGAAKDAEGKVVNGTIRAKVFADEAGDSYNKPAGTTFTVPGFKENGYEDLYKAVTAKNPEAISGGFAGPKFIINDAELSTARQSLQMALRDSLLARIETEKPAGFTSFKDSVAITYNQLPPVQYGDNLVTIKEQAVLQMPLFKAEDFASFIAKESIVGYEDEGVRIDNLNDLKFAYSNATTSQSLIGDMESLTFKITGEPKIVWTFDEGKLKVDLLGVEKTAIPQIMSSYTGIEKSEVSVRPIWKRTMPKELNDIEVVEKLSTE